MKNFQNSRFSDFQIFITKKASKSAENAPSVAKILSLVQDSSIEKQAQILNYESLSDQHLLPLVEKLTQPLSGKMKYEEKVYNQKLENFMKR